MPAPISPSSPTRMGLRQRREEQFRTAFEELACDVLEGNVKYPKTDVSTISAGELAVRAIGRAKVKGQKRRQAQEERIKHMLDGINNTGSDADNNNSAGEDGSSKVARDEKSRGGKAAGKSRLRQHELERKRAKCRDTYAQAVARMARSLDNCDNLFSKASNMAKAALAHGRRTQRLREDGEDGVEARDDDDDGPASPTSKPKSSTATHSPKLPVDAVATPGAEPEPLSQKMMQYEERRADGIVDEHASQTAFFFSYLSCPGLDDNDTTSFIRIVEQMDDAIERGRQELQRMEEKYLAVTSALATELDSLREWACDIPDVARELIKHREPPLSVGGDWLSRYNELHAELHLYRRHTQSMERCKMMEVDEVYQEERARELVRIGARAGEIKWTKAVHDVGVGVNVADVAPGIDEHVQTDRPHHAPRPRLYSPKSGNPMQHDGDDALGAMPVALDLVDRLSHAHGVMVNRLSQLEHQLHDKTSGRWGVDLDQQQINNDSVSSHRSDSMMRDEMTYLVVMSNRVQDGIDDSINRIVALVEKVDANSLPEPASPTSSKRRKNRFSMDKGQLDEDIIVAETGSQVLLPVWIGTDIAVDPVEEFLPDSPRSVADAWVQVGDDDPMQQFSQQNSDSEEGVEEEGRTDTRLQNDENEDVAELLNDDDQNRAEADRAVASSEAPSSSRRGSELHGPDSGGTSANPSFTSQRLLSLDGRSSHDDVAAGESRRVSRVSSANPSIVAERRLSATSDTAEVRSRRVSQSGPRTPRRQSADPVPVVVERVERVVEYVEVLPPPKETADVASLTDPVDVRPVVVCTPIAVQVVPITQDRCFTVCPATDHAGTGTTMEDVAEYRHDVHTTTTDLPFKVVEDVLTYDVRTQVGASYDAFVDGGAQTDPVAFAAGKKAGGGPRRSISSSSTTGGKKAVSGAAAKGMKFDDFEAVPEEPVSPSAVQAGSTRKRRKSTRRLSVASAASGASATSPMLSPSGASFLRSFATAEEASSVDEDANAKATSGQATPPDPTMRMSIVVVDDASTEQVVAATSCEAVDEPQGAAASVGVQARLLPESEDKRLQANMGPAMWDQGNQTIVTAVEDRGTNPEEAGESSSHPVEQGSLSGASSAASTTRGPVKVDHIGIQVDIINGDLPSSALGGSRHTPTDLRQRPFNFNDSFNKSGSFVSPLRHLPEYTGEVVTRTGNPTPISSVVHQPSGTASSFVAPRDGDAFDLSYQRGMSSGDLGETLEAKYEQRRGGRKAEASPMTGPGRVTVTSPGRGQPKHQPKASHSRAARPPIPKRQFEDFNDGAACDESGSRHMETHEKIRHTAAPSSAKGVPVQHMSPGGKPGRLAALGNDRSDGVPQDNSKHIVGRERHTYNHVYRGFLVPETVGLGGSALRVSPRREGPSTVVEHPGQAPTESSYSVDPYLRRGVVKQNEKLMDMTFSKKTRLLQSTEKKAVSSDRFVKKGRGQPKYLEPLGHEAPPSCAISPENFEDDIYGEIIHEPYYP